MAFSLLGYIAGFVIGSGSGLDNTQAAEVAILPGLLGLSVPSLLVTGVIAQQQAASRQPQIAQDVLLPDVTFNAANITAASTTLQNLGLTVQEETESKPILLPANIVTAESPGAGTSVPAGSTVVLTKSIRETETQSPRQNKASKDRDRRSLVKP